MKLLDRLLFLLKTLRLFFADDTKFNQSDFRINVKFKKKTIGIVFGRIQEKTQNIEFQANSGVSCLVIIPLFETFSACKLPDNGR